MTDRPIPPRSEVPQELTWNLLDLFPGERCFLPENGERR